MIISRPIHVATNGIISFFSVDEQYSIMCVYVYTYIYIEHNIFIHSSVDGHLSCFSVLTIVNSATLNIGVHVSF